MSDQKLSKYISYLLRHEPESAGLKLDEQGWVSVTELITAVNRKHPITPEILDRIVNSSDKKRFSYSQDKARIRANHGHTVSIDLEYPEEKPPAFLYHGTAEKFVAAIDRDGLISKKRIHVHLSTNEEKAREVGARRGQPVLYKVLSGKMYDCGHKFYHSASDIWLTESVPVEFLKKIEV